jgi:hypothetical protein
MLEFDPSTGMLAFPISVSAAIAAVVLVLAVLALARSGLNKTVGALAVLAALGFAGWVGWSVLEQRTSGSTAVAMSGGERSDDRRLFEQRVNELVGRAMLPGSPLACLDGTAGEQVATGCERLIFSSPENVSAAVSYVAMRLNLLAEGTQMASGSAAYENSLGALRQGLESDRFGIVAYLLLQQPECKPEQCPRLSLLRDPNKIRVNLLERPYDVLVARYSVNWQLAGRNGGDVRGGNAVAVAVPPPSLPNPAISGTGAPTASKYEFPSANSIPAVSIMNAEPSAPPPKEAAPAKEASAPPASRPAPAPKRPPPPKPAPRPVAAAPPAAEAAPTQLAPAAAQR